MLTKTQQTETAELISISGSEKALIAMVKQGDQSAFRKLYDLHIGKVYALCLRLTGNRTQAEEASQEVFLTVWRKLNLYKGESRFSTWLHRLTSNTTLSYLRKQRTWKERFFSGEQHQKVLDETEYDEPTDISKLDSLLPRLPAQARIVFVLHAIEGYRHEHIAQELKISTATSKVHFHRAKKLISQWLEEMQ